MRSHKEMDLVSNFMGLQRDRAETTTRPPLSMENLVEKMGRLGNWGRGDH